MKTAIVLSLSAVMGVAPVCFAQNTAASVTGVPASASAAAAVSPTTAVPVGPDANGRYMLREGEDVSLKFAQDLSSKTAADGDPVALLLDEDLKVGGVVVAKAGSKAFGEVTNAKSRE